MARAERRGVPPGNVREHFLYKVYGITVASELRLPELVEVKGLNPDATIRFGVVPKALDHVKASWANCIASRSECLISVDGVASYHIQYGHSITIERRFALSGASSLGDVRSWLLGWVFATLLHQRGLLPFHVSAVKAPGGVWAFTGVSGEGKSTLAGYLQHRFGCELVSDDVSALDPTDTIPIINPGPKRLKLWPDALDFLELGSNRKIQDLSGSNKFQIAVDDNYVYYPPRLDGLVSLETVPNGTSPTIERLRGAEAFNVCMSAIYRPLLGFCFNEPDPIMNAVASLCREIQVYRFRRPRSFDSFDSSISILSELLKTPIHDSLPDYS